MNTLQIKLFSIGVTVAGILFIIAHIVYMVLANRFMIVTGRWFLAMLAIVITMIVLEIFNVASVIAKRYDKYQPIFMTFVCWMSAFMIMSGPELMK